MCFMKKKDHKNAINFCNLSLELDQTFIKPLMNRANCHFELGNNQEALDDYKLIAEKSPENANPMRVDILQKKVDAEMEVKKEQMLDQLKGLGNSLLGKFGMSLDNFKLNKNEQGGYNVQYAPPK